MGQKHWLDPLARRLLIATGQIQAPAGTAWGWKQTNYSTNLITKTNQVEQVISWTFAHYDLDIYPFF